jgi:hypothetical protein
MGATTTNGAAKARSRTVGVFEIGEKERSVRTWIIKAQLGKCMDWIGMRLKN